MSNQFILNKIESLEKEANSLVENIENLKSFLPQESDEEKIPFFHSAFELLESKQLKVNAIAMDVCREGEEIVEYINDEPAQIDIHYSHFEISIWITDKGRAYNLIFQIDQI